MTPSQIRREYSRAWAGWAAAMPAALAHAGPRVRATAGPAVAQVTRAWSAAAAQWGTDPRSALRGMRSALLTAQRIDGALRAAAAREPDTWLGRAVRTLSPVASAMHEIDAVLGRLGTLARSIDTAAAEATAAVLGGSALVGIGLAAVAAYALLGRDR